MCSLLSDPWPHLWPCLLLPWMLITPVTREEKWFISSKMNFPGCLLFGIWLTHTYSRIFYYSSFDFCLMLRFPNMTFFASHDLYMHFLRKKCPSSNTTLLVSTLKSSLVRNLLWEAFQAPPSYLSLDWSHTALCYRGALTRTSIVPFIPLHCNVLTLIKEEIWANFCLCITCT